MAGPQCQAGTGAAVCLADQQKPGPTRHGGKITHQTRRSRHVHCEFPHQGVRHQVELLNDSTATSAHIQGVASNEQPSFPHQSEPERRYKRTGRNGLKDRTIGGVEHDELVAIGAILRGHAGQQALARGVPGQVQGSYAGFSNHRTGQNVERGALALSDALFGH